VGGVTERPALSRRDREGVEGEGQRRAGLVAGDVDLDAPGPSASLYTCPRPLPLMYSPRGSGGGSGGGAGAGLGSNCSHSIWTSPSSSAFSTSKSGM